MYQGPIDSGIEYVNNIISKEPLNYNNFAYESSSELMAHGYWTGVLEDRDAEMQRWLFGVHGPDDILQHPIMNDCNGIILLNK